MIAEKDLDVREILSFVMEARFNAEVSAVSDPEEANKLLGEGVHLVFCNVDDVWPEIQKYISSKSIKTPCIGISFAETPPKGEGLLAVLRAHTLIEETAAVVEKLFETGALDKKERHLNYLKLRTELLLRTSPLKADMYIRLSDKKYIKLFHEGADFDKGDFEKYTQKKGVNYLFLRNDQYEEFFNKFREQLQALEKKPDLTQEEAANALESSIETVNEMVRKVGFSKNVQALVKTNVNLSMKSMGKKPKFSDILDKLKNLDPEKYIAQHSMLLAHMACSLARQMKWTSKQTYEKLTMAAMMHDIVFENNELAKLSSQKEIMAKKNDFSQKQVKLFREHPDRAAALVKKMSDVLPDVDQIIAQHHEQPDGSGFPRRIDQALIAPLSSLFIVAEDLVRAAYDEMDKFDPAVFFNKRLTFYNVGHFKQVVRAAKKIKL